MSTWEKLRTMRKNTRRYNKELEKYEEEYKNNKLDMSFSGISESQEHLNAISAMEHVHESCNSCVIGGRSLVKW